MKWDLVEIDPNYSIVFILILLIQTLVFIFFFFYFLNHLVDIIATRRKLHYMEKEFKEVSDKKAFKKKLLIQKDKCGINAWLIPIIEHLIFCIENENANDQRIQQEKLFSVFDEKVSKNKDLFKFMIYFSISSVLFAFYEVRTSFYLDKSDVLRMFIVSSIIIGIILVIFHLRKKFCEYIKTTIIDLKMLIANCTT